MSKIIIHNRANITDNHALECACMVLDEIFEDYCEENNLHWSAEDE